MAKKRDAEVVSKKEKAAMKEGTMGMKRLGRVEKSIEKKRDVAREKSWSPDQATRDKAFKDMDKPRTKANRTAFKMGFKGSEGERRRDNR